MSKISSIDVWLDDNVPDDMTGVIRIGSVKINFDDKTVKSCDKLVDNAEFNEVESHADAVDEMKDYIIDYLINNKMDSVSKENINIITEEC